MCVLQSFNEYFTVNHSRLVSLWRTAVTFRHQFMELKATTDHELVTLRAEFSRLSRGMNAACLNLSTQLRSTNVKHQVFITDPLLYVTGRRNLFFLFLNAFTQHRHNTRVKVL